MTIVAIAILMLAASLFTVSAFIQVLNHSTQKIRLVGSMEPRASLWLYLGGLLAVAIGSFLYSQSQTGNPTWEFVVFLVVANLPLVLIRLIHNHRVAGRQAVG